MKSPIFTTVNDQMKEHLKFPMEKEMNKALKEVSRILAENKNAMAMAFAAETGCHPQNVVMVTQGLRTWFEPKYDPAFHAIYVTMDGLECIARLLTDRYGKPQMIVKRPVHNQQDLRMAHGSSYNDPIPHFQERTYEMIGQKKKGLWIYREA